MHSPGGERCLCFKDDIGCMDPASCMNTHCTLTRGDGDRALSTLPAVRLMRDAPGCGTVSG